MDQPNPDWLRHLVLTDEGASRPLYPYSLLKNILSPSDCREAVLNETAPFEEEFGQAFVQSFDDLLWRINTVTDVFTTHATVSSSDRKSPFEWAKAFVGSAIIILPRTDLSRHQSHSAEDMASMLVRLLANSKEIPKDTTGWQVLVYPTTLTLLYDTALVNDDRSFVLEQGARTMCRIWT